MFIMQDAADYGQTDSGVITQYVRPNSGSPAVMKEMCGKTRGIQGSRNSCYLDATLYSMFAHCSAFDRHAHNFFDGSKSTVESAVAPCNSDQMSLWDIY
jgi:hypothetical protein